MNAHRVRLEPAQLAVTPGAEAACTVHVTNAGDVVDAYDIEVVGAAMAWTAVEPASVSLFPAVSGTVRLTFRPPRSPEVPAGPMPFGVRVQSRTAGEQTSVVEEGTLEVARYTELAGELLPHTSHGRFGGHHRVQVTNRGNAPAEVRLSGSDPEQALRLALTAPALVVPPGADRSSGLRARFARTSAAGQPRRWAFQVTAEAEATAPVELQGAVEQLPLLGRWTRRALGLGGIALVVAGVLQFTGLGAAASGLIGTLSGAVSTQASPGAGGTAGPGGAGTGPSPSSSAPGGGSPSPSASGGTGGAGTSPAAARPMVPAVACAGTPASIAASSVMQPIPGLSVSLDSGSSARRALVDLSANLGVDIDAEVRVAYSVDGGPAVENAFGPANLANHQQYFEARAVRAVVPLPAGTHTIAATWRVSGVAGKTATIDRRCLTVRSVLTGAPDSSPVVAAAACAGSPISISAPNPAQPISGLSVTVNDGASARQALVGVTANLGVDVDAEVRLAYSVDGGPPQENAYGPANLANHQQYYEGREVTAVIPLGPGSHTIAATWRVSGVAGKSATMGERCLTVESVQSPAPATSQVVAAAACAGTGASTSAPAGAQPVPGLSVSVNDGSSARQALVTVSANLGVDLDAEVRLAYSVDGGPPQENVYGPANLANHQQYYEGRAATAVIPLGPGSHTITATWRVSGAAGKTATIDRRCLIVESVA